MNPSDLYGASKAAAEHIGRQYANHYGVDWRCARPYFFFGPGKFPSEQPFLFKNLLGPLEGTTGPPARKRGRPTARLHERERHRPRGRTSSTRPRRLRHDTYNFASEVPVSFRTWSRLAQKYSAEAHGGADRSRKALPPRGETLDISLAREELGFEPRYGVEDVMREYAEWIERNRERRPV